MVNHGRPVRRGTLIDTLYFHSAATIVQSYVYVFAGEKKDNAEMKSLCLDNVYVLL